MHPKLTSEPHISNGKFNIDYKMPSLLEKQCTCRYISQKMDVPDVFQPQAMNCIPPYRRHIALLLMEAIWTVNIHDCIHGKLWPVPHNSSHH
ncbi:putative delta(7)-sterol 5(6)-desaturase [Helianthus anomalus]